MTRYTCYYCGRKTEPCTFVNGKAVGPTCARKEGILTRTVAKKSVADTDAVTIDMFTAYNETEPEKSGHQPD